MFAVILAGGSGTRFWPLSRESSPKQLLNVFGETTMIQQAVMRLDGAIPVKNVFVVTGKKYAFDIRSQLREVCGSEDFTVLAEPEGRNTAPAIGLAAMHIRKISREGVMAVIPSDHVILKEDVFLEVLGRAAGLARKGYLTTIGIIPRRAETGYGYIKRGKRLAEGGRGKRDEAVFSVERFVEKPDLETADSYVRSGTYYWNSGIFVWRAADILKEIRRFLPELHKGLCEIGDAIGTKKEGEVLSRTFKTFSPVSIDYGVMEKAAKVAVVPADMGWSDVGSWRSLEDVSEKDGDGNIVSGNVVDVGSKDSIIYAGRRVVATVGLKDMVVVDTPDATLICDKNKTQDVRKVVDILKERGAGELIEHVTTHRPWGSYTILEIAERYKIKRIVVKPGAKLSLQLHHHRSEHWVVVEGTARVTVGDKVFNVHPNESTYVPISSMHRLENPGKVPLHLIEVQIGDYIEEDDIVRVDDEYGR